MPSPEALEKFKEVDPTLPHRMMSLSEGEARHRRERETEQDSQRRYTITQDARLMWAGLIAGVGIFSWALWKAVAFFEAGNTTAGLTMAGPAVLTAIVTIATVAFNSRKAEKDRAKKG
jgi:uncharacterized membrane protein